MEEFEQWYECRDVIPKIQEIKENAVQDFNWRLQKVMRELPMESEKKMELKEEMSSAAGKVIAKMLFTLRDNVPQENFRECVEALSQLYQTEN